jgi:hypothetical protein
LGGKAGEPSFFISLFVWFNFHLKRILFKLLYTNFSVSLLITLEFLDFLTAYPVTGEAELTVIPVLGEEADWLGWCLLVYTLLLHTVFESRKVFSLCGTLRSPLQASVAS